MRPQVCEKREVNLFGFVLSQFVLFVLYVEMEAGMVGLCVTYALLLTGMFQWCVRQSGEVGNQVK